MYSSTIAATVVAALMASANAHLAISNPAPIPGSNSKSPLEPSGSNFPCQGASLTSGPVTNMAAGSVQPLKFDIGPNGENWAVHGGGSCQISITYETDAAKLKNPANWKVLHSWLGGCPTNAKLNLDPVAIACSGAPGQCVNQGFTFTVPQEVKAGNGILAWTWFNNIGNREMYMNCARVAITGGTGNVDSLPGMFTANIGNGCATKEEHNTDFPNPGKYVTKDSTPNYPFQAPVGSCGTGAGSAGTPSSSGSGSAASGSASSAASSRASSGASSGASSAASPVGSAASPVGSAAAAPSTSSGRGRKSSTGTFAEGAPAAEAAPAASGVASKPEVPVAGATPGSGSNGAVPCTAQGFYCISATTFGLCANGFAVPQQVAAGTTCSGSTISAVRRHLNIRHMQHRRHYFGSSS